MFTLAIFAAGADNYPLINWFRSIGKLSPVIKWLDLTKWIEKLTVVIWSKATCLKFVEFTQSGTTLQKLTDYRGDGCGLREGFAFNMMN